MLTMVDVVGAVDRQGQKVNKAATESVENSKSASAALMC